MISTFDRAAVQAGLDRFSAACTAVVPLWLEAMQRFAAALHEAVAQFTALTARSRPVLAAWERRQARAAATAHWLALAPRQRKDAIRRHRRRTLHVER